MVPSNIIGYMSEGGDTFIKRERIMESMCAEITACEIGKCAFNVEGKCHTWGINVGDKEPRCDTFLSATKKGGKPDLMARVGACKIARCRFNDSFECTSAGISVKLLQGRAMCGTFVAASVQ